MKITVFALFMLAGPGCAFAAGHAVIENIRDQQLNLTGPVTAAEVAPVGPAVPVESGNVMKSAAFDERYFNTYILKAVDWLYANYGLLGYDVHSILTHDIAYHASGKILARNPPLTMCVAAQMEVILTAYQFYAEENGDYSVYEYLPKRSFEGLRVTDLKGHIWVNHGFNSYGTADALINFGMGERTEFEGLKPGSFVNINRDNRTGHAVTFINFIDDKGNGLPGYDPAAVAGFKYFSSQGGYAAGQGGFGYRYAIFRDHGCPDIPGRDCGVINSADQRMLNTGTMLSPKYWDHSAAAGPPTGSGALGDTVLDAEFFNGVTPDRVNPDY